jgi:hypothetical protein
LRDAPLPTLRLLISHYREYPAAVGWAKSPRDPAAEAPMAAILPIIPRLDVVGYGA